MKRLLLLLVVCLLVTLPAWGRQRYSSYCQQGGGVVNIGGLPSLTQFMQSFPGCTITVYITGTTTPAVLYADTVGTPKPNPFTADTDTGAFFFYADNGRYDIQETGTDFTPFTLGDNSLFDITAPLTIDIIGGTIDGTPIGSTTPSTGAFTTLSTPKLNNIRYLSGFSSLTTACADLSGNNGTVVINTQLTLSGDTVTPINCNLTWVGNGLITLNNFNLTINGLIANPVALNPQQLFVLPGTVTLGAQVKQAAVEWFGAIGDWNGTTGTDNTAAIQACLNAMSNGQCTLLNKAYKTTSALTISKSVVGIIGVSSSITSAALYTTPVSSALVTTSASANVITATGVNSSNNITYNVFKNFRIARAITPSGTASGLSLSFSYGAIVDNVMSEDSIYDFYLHGVGSQGTGYIANSAATWGYNGVAMPATGNLRGFFIDSSGGVPSPSLRFRNNFAAANPATVPHSASYTTSGVVLTGTQLNDFHSFHFESATVDYGMYINSSSLGFTNSTDIFVSEPVNDGCYITCIYIANIAGTLTISGGWSFIQSSAGNVAAIDIEGGSNVSVVNHKVYYGGTTVPAILAQTSGSIALIGNTLTGTATAISFNNTNASVVSGNVANGLNTTTGFNFVNSKINTITNNVINGTLTNGIRLDSNSTSNTGLETNAIGLAALGVITNNISDSGANRSPLNGLLANIGLTNGTGIQYLHTGLTTATAASIGATATTTFTWGVTWADTTYDVICTADNSDSSGSGVIGLSGITSKTTTQFTVATFAVTAAAAQAKLACYGYHRN